jgi:flagellar motility protein MotE (MotC chaperone)
MTSAHADKKRRKRNWLWVAVSPLIPALGLLAVSVMPAFAQQAWVPTVATSPGGSFYSPPGTGTRMSTDIDPRYFPSPNSQPAQTGKSLPQGAWSPIITGGIPQQEPVPATTVVVTPSEPTDSYVPPLDALSPIRPLTTLKTVTAAAGAQNSGESREDAPAKPNSATSEADKNADGVPVFKKPGPLDTPPPNATAAQQYCFNTVDTAADARFAWQAKKIKEMEAEIDKRAQQLEAKTEEYKLWLQRRDDFSRKAHEKLVGFYSRMRPDAAALQLATLDEEMAAAVVTKLETKVASQIMGEMNPEQAAKIATIISGAAKIPSDRKRAAVPPESASPGAPNAAPLPLPEQPRS